MFTITKETPCKNFRLTYLFCSYIKLPKKKIASVNKGQQRWDCCFSVDLYLGFSITLHWQMYLFSLQGYMLSIAFLLGVNFHQLNHFYCWPPVVYKTSICQLCLCIGHRSAVTQLLAEHTTLNYKDLKSDVMKQNLSSPEGTDSDLKRVQRNPIFFQVQVVISLQIHSIANLRIWDST